MTESRLPFRVDGEVVLDRLIPPIEILDIDGIKEPIILICAAGFEDRATVFLDKALEQGLRIGGILAIQYEPYRNENRKDDFLKRLKQVNIPENKKVWVTYNCLDPEVFSKELLSTKQIFASGYTIVVDISAMSKFLIVVLLQNLRDLTNGIKIIYTEAGEYFPTEKEFRSSIEELSQISQKTPIFLTTDVDKIVSTSSLSTDSMQGYPSIVIVFPTFNHRELYSIINELSPHRLILLEGIPHENHNYWRLKAIRDINKSVESYFPIEYAEVSTFNYLDTIKQLERLYIDNGDSNRIIIAPTGSKLQTFAVFLFKQLHPDVQIIYPVTRGFVKEITKSYKAIWAIHIHNFSEFMNLLDNYRKRGLVGVYHKIKSLQNPSSKPKV
jgi:hypothetical protein